MKSLEVVLEEFVLALRDEIAALKAGKGGRNTPIYNGVLIAKVDPVYRYRFNLEDFLIAMEDSPGELIINGERYDCQILFVDGLAVEISMEQFLGERIEEAILHINPWFLLEILARKITDNKSMLVHSKLVQGMYAGVSRTVTTKEPVYTKGAQPPNKHQATAIKNSFAQSLAIIWGPPGTGKTATIARAAEAHLNAGRRVLICSHSNTAVDQALLKIAAQLKHTQYYADGKLIRLGVPRLPDLEEQCPLVLPKEITKRKSTHLHQERSKYQALTSDLRKRTQMLTEVLQLAHVILAMDNRHKALRAERKAKTKQASALLKRIGAGKHDLALAIKLRNTLRADNPIVRAVRYRLLSQVAKLTYGLHAKSRQLKQLQDEIKAHNAHIARNDADLDDLAKRAASIFSSLALKAEELGSAAEAVEAAYQDLVQNMRRIDNEMARLEKDIVTNAQLVATTLTKTFSSGEFPEQPFDVVIVDEISMASLPQLFWAVSRATQQVTLVGDFLQLSAIATGDTGLVDEWLKSNIFGILGITDPAEANRDKRVSALLQQYRMLPEIAYLPNKYFYAGLLQTPKPHNSPPPLVTIGGSTPLVLIDTSEINPRGRQLTKSRCNIYSALITALTAKRVVKDLGRAERIGVVTPYRPQATLIARILRDLGLEQQVHVNTVHSFQGGEETAIIFDCVEGPSLKNWSMLDDTQTGRDAKELLNVAITRTKKKFILISNAKHLASRLNQDAIILSILEDIRQLGTTVDPLEVVESFNTNDYYPWISKPSTTEPTNFWPVFYDDLCNAKQSVFIMSPQTSEGRCLPLALLFSLLTDRGVAVTVYTRPPKEQRRNNSKKAIDLLAKNGARVVQRSKMQHKTAIIDDVIAWSGELDILHKSAATPMLRHHGHNAVRSIKRYLEISSKDAPGDLTELLCPNCSSSLVVRNGRNGNFLACSAYPWCKHTQPMPRRGA